MMFKNQTNALKPYLKTMFLSLPATQSVPGESNLVKSGFGVSQMTSKRSSAARSWRFSTCDAQTPFSSSHPNLADGACIPWGVQVSCLGVSTTRLSFFPQRKGGGCNAQPGETLQALAGRSVLT